MNANQIKNMVTRVPTIRKSVDLKSFCVSQLEKSNLIYLDEERGWSALLVCWSRDTPNCRCWRH